MVYLRRVEDPHPPDAARLRHYCQSETGSMKADGPVQCDCGDKKKKKKQHTHGHICVDYNRLVFKALLNLFINDVLQPWEFFFSLLFLITPIGDLFL